MPKKQLPIYDDRGRLLAYRTEELARMLGMSQQSDAFVRKHLTVYDDRRILSRKLLRRRKLLPALGVVVGASAKFLPIVDEDGKYLGASAAEVGAMMYLSGRAILRRLVMSPDGKTRVLRSVAQLPVYDENDNLLGNDVKSVVLKMSVAHDTLRRYMVTIPGVRKVVYVQRLKDRKPLRSRSKRSKTDDAMVVRGGGVAGVAGGGVGDGGVDSCGA